MDKHLVAYISELDTSKEIYDRLVSLLKVNDANQVLFLRNKLMEIKKGKDESMQAYFLRITLGKLLLTGKWHSQLLEDYHSNGTCSGLLF